MPAAGSDSRQRTLPRIFVRGRGATGLRDPRACFMFFNFLFLFLLSLLSGGGAPVPLPLLLLVNSLFLVLT